MAVLKYKNGSTWTELKLGNGLNEYPVGSFYVSPFSIYALAGNYAQQQSWIASYDLLKYPSPASLFGGSWTLIQPSTLNNNYYLIGLNDSNSFIQNILAKNISKDTTAFVGSTLNTSPPIEQTFDPSYSGSSLSQSLYTKNGTIYGTGYFSNMVWKATGEGIKMNDGGLDYRYIICRVWQRIS